MQTRTTAQMLDEMLRRPPMDSQALQSQLDARWLALLPLVVCTSMSTEQPADDGPWAGYTPAEIRAQLAKEKAVLGRLEIPWRDRQPFLLQRGYVLRPRYHPGWVASWVTNPALRPRQCEDYIEHPVSDPLMSRPQ